MRKKAKKRTPKPSKFVHIDEFDPCVGGIISRLEAVEKQIRGLQQIAQTLDFYRKNPPNANPAMAKDVADLTSVQTDLCNRVDSLEEADMTTQQNAKTLGDNFVVLAKRIQALEAKPTIRPRVRVIIENEGGSP